MAVKIFAKISYNINGFASPSFILALAWNDVLNTLDSDERKIISFLDYQSFPFFTKSSMYSPTRPNVRTSNLPIYETWEEFVTIFGFVENEKFPFDEYDQTIGFIGNNMVTEKLAFIMNNLAYDTAHGDGNTEPAEVFFYIHKLTADDIDSFLNEHTVLENVNASVTDFYDLLLPCIATKNDMCEADGYRQATQKDNAIVFYADCINYL